MSVEKIDLVDVEKYPLFVPDEVLFALVAVVRAVMAVRLHDREVDVDAPEEVVPLYEALDAALSRITDSAEVRSDGA